jgi:phage gp46-like protein
MTDVLLRETDNGGDITVEAGLFLLSEGLETAVFLSLFGGNEQDPGEGASSEQWWGNIGEVEPARTYRSETQYLLRALPAIPANLLRIEQAAGRDLQWLLDEGAAKSVTAAARIPSLNRVVVDVGIVVLATLIQFSFG